MGHSISDICTTKFMQALSLEQMAFKQMGPDGNTYFTVLSVNLR